VLKEEKQEEEVEEDEGELANLDSTLPLHTSDDKPSDLDLIKQEQVHGTFPFYSSLFLVPLSTLNSRVWYQLLDEPVLSK
jgi:hypothetical protein